MAATCCRARPGAPRSRSPVGSPRSRSTKFRHGPDRPVPGNRVRAAFQNVAGTRSGGIGGPDRRSWSGRFYLAANLDCSRWSSRLPEPPDRAERQGRGRTRGLRRGGGRSVHEHLHLDGGGTSTSTSRRLASERERQSRWRCSLPPRVVAVAFRSTAVRS
jgi:hypothetical protein